METKQESHGVRLTAFLPNARCLSEEEIRDLPSAKRREAEGAGVGGLWLELECKEGVCLVDERGVVIPVRAVTEDEKEKLGVRKKEGFWLNLFCPHDRCIIEDGTDLP